MCAAPTRLPARPWVVLMIQVLDEIGVDLTASMAAAPQKRVAAKQQQPQHVAAQEDDSDVQLAKLLAALK